MESPAPLLQRYNIFGPKARNVKIAKRKKMTFLAASNSDLQHGTRACGT